MSTMTVTHDRIREALAPFALAPLPDDPDASLFDGGVIDSFGLMDAIASLEKVFDVSVPDSDLNPRRFETLGKIERYFEARARA